MLGDALGQLPVLGDDVTGRLAVELASVLHWLLLGAVAVALVAASAWRPRWARGIAGLAVAVALVDLVSMGRGYHPAVDKSVVDPPVPPSVRFLQRAVADGSRSLGEGLTYPANLAAALPDARRRASTSCRRSSARTGSGLRSAGPGSATRRRSRSSLSEPGHDRLADLFAVRWLYSPTLAAAPRPGYRPVTGQSNVVENLDAFPRAWVAHSWRAADGFDAALRLVSASTSRQLFASPVIEGVAARRAGPAPEPATVERQSDDEVVLSATASTPGYLVLDDTFYPGWKAEVDGHDEEIEPANGAFRAIRLDAGRHEVSFAYESAAVRWGWIVSLLGLLCAAGLAGFALVRRRRASASS